MNNVITTYMCWFFQFFNSPVALKKFERILAPLQEKVEMTYDPVISYNSFPITDVWTFCNILEKL